MVKYKASSVQEVLTNKGIEEKTFRYYELHRDWTLGIPEEYDETVSIFLAAYNYEDDAFTLGVQHGDSTLYINVVNDAVFVFNLCWGVDEVLINGREKKIALMLSEPWFD